jgi:hypothetical protein
VSRNQPEFSKSRRLYPPLLRQSLANCALGADL